VPVLIGKATVDAGHKRVFYHKIRIAHPANSLHAAWHDAEGQWLTRIINALFT
jgi:hypothetical protein